MIRLIQGLVPGGRWLAGAEGDKAEGAGEENYVLVKYSYQ